MKQKLHFHVSIFTKHNFGTPKAIIGIQEFANYVLLIGKLIGFVQNQVSCQKQDKIQELLGVHY